MLGSLSLIAIAIGSWILLDRFLTVAHDAKEPPLVPQKFPYIGHVVGMLYHGNSYYSKLSKEHDLPIFTLRVPRGKIYVATLPGLVSAIDRQSKYISFAPYIVEFAKRLLMPTQSAVDALAANLIIEPGAQGLTPEVLKAMHISLAPGEQLESTKHMMLASAIELVADMGSHVRDGSMNSVELFSCVRQLVTSASTDALYGREKNPFHDPEVVSGFWATDKDFAYLGLNILPSFLAPTASRGRGVFFDAFIKYYEEDGYKTASPVVQARHEVSTKYLSLKDMAHFDLSLCYGLLANTVPTCFWSICNVYSRPELIRTLRDALAANIDFRDNGSESEDQQEISVNVPNVISSCPLLLSVVQETLRIHSTGAAARIVLKDTIIEDKYHLRKDALVFLPSPDLHRSASIWGPTVDEFDPYRFLSKRAPSDYVGRLPVSVSAYRAFGGGASVCPGRHLAASEVQSFLVMMLLRFDVSPVRGEWVLPKSIPHIAKTVLMPAEELRVNITERRGFEGRKWRFVWEDSRAEKPEKSD